MKRIIKFVVLVGIVLMCLFPPWRMQSGARNSFLKTLKYRPGTTYGFIMHPPDNASSIDMQLLLAQVIIVIISGKLYYNYYRYRRDLKAFKKTRRHYYTPDRND